MTVRKEFISSANVLCAKWRDTGISEREKLDSLDFDELMTAIGVTYCGGPVKVTDYDNTTYGTGTYWVKFELDLPDPVIVRGVIAEAMQELAKDPKISVDMDTKTVRSNYNMVRVERWTMIVSEESGPCLCDWDNKTVAEKQEIISLAHRTNYKHCQIQEWIVLNDDPSLYESLNELMGRECQLWTRAWLGDVMDDPTLEPGPGEDGMQQVDEHERELRENPEAFE